MWACCAVVQVTLPRFAVLRPSSEGILTGVCGPHAEKMVQPYVRAARRYHPAEIEADFAVHLFGMFVGAIAAAVLLALAASANLTTL
jgi:hypothetical protein